MSVKVTAVIRKRSLFDPRAGTPYNATSLSLLNESGDEYGVERYFGAFSDVATLLIRESGASFELLLQCLSVYERNNLVEIALILENEERIANLGFNPKAA
jgi:hypothetical protein